MDAEDVGVGPVPPPGPVSLPPNATLVSDADEEIFLLYTRLAALKPPDSTDTGHFHGLGSENSNQDALLVRIELTPPSTAQTPLHQPEKVNRKARNAERRSRVGKGKRSGGGSDPAMEGSDGLAPGRKGKPEPLVFEYELFQDKTALRSRSGDTGSVLWKAR
jgi:protein N-lysine methyltransferase METTL21D